MVRENFVACDVLSQLQRVMDNPRFLLTGECEPLSAGRGSVSTQAAGHMFAWLKSRGRFLRLFDIVIAPSIAQCCSGDPVGPSKFTRDAKAPDGQPPRGLLFIMRPQRPRAWRRALPFF